MYNPESLSTDSFLLNHSVEYGLAAVMSWLEFGVEAYLFPSMKCLWVVNIVGLLLVVFGETMRKGERVGLHFFPFLKQCSIKTYLDLIS